MSKTTPQAATGALDRRKSQDKTARRESVAGPMRVFIELTAQDGDATAALGVLEFDLAPDRCPKACDNFRALCAGCVSTDKKVTKTVGYKGTSVIRIREFMFQAGDVAGKEANGKGQDSMFGIGIKFEDESLGQGVPCDRAGVLGMVNCGPNSNASQFFVTLTDAPWLDDGYVTFGRLVEGKGEDVLQKVAAARQYTDVRGFLHGKAHAIVISNCGVVANPPS